MGILANLETGWTLSMDSLAVLREHPKLLAFPAISGVATAVFAVFLLGGVFVGEFIGVAERRRTPDRDLVEGRI